MGVSVSGICSTDNSKIAKGKKIFINEKVYSADGSAKVSGNNILVHFSSKEEADNFPEGDYEIFEAVVETIPPTGVTPNGSPTGPADGSIPPSIYYTACQSYLGIPYVWGGESLAEGGYDCSGFVYALMKGLGYSWGRTTASGQSAYGSAVTVAGSGYGLDNAIPGDLLFNAGKKGISHVMCYLGNGYMVHSPQSGDVIKIAKVYQRPYCIRRLF